MGIRDAELQRQRLSGQGEWVIDRESGMTGVSAVGEVFNLKHLQDFNGHYNVGAEGTRGVTIAKGKAGTLMHNQAGVIVRLAATQTGLDVNATGGGVDMQIQR